MTAAQFKAWHDSYKADRGYPLQGRNAATGEPVDVGWTTEYTAPVVVDAGDVRFEVDPKDVPVLPGKKAARPVFKADDTLDVAKSKADQAALEAKPK